MYIPFPPRDPAHSPSSTGGPRWASAPGRGPSHYTAAEQPSLRHLLQPDAVATHPSPTPRALTPIARFFGRLASSADSRISTLRKRGSSYQTTNITIGIVIAILLSAFLVAVFLFCHRYRPTTGFTRRRKRQRRKSGGSKSSKASTDGGPTPAEAVPAPAG
jgi:hypothetical protein